MCHGKKGKKGKEKKTKLHSCSQPCSFFRNCRLRKVFNSRCFFFLLNEKRGEINVKTIFFNKTFFSFFLSFFQRKSKQYWAGLSNRWSWWAACCSHVSSQCEPLLSRCCKTNNQMIKDDNNQINCTQWICSSEVQNMWPLSVTLWAASAAKSILQVNKTNLKGFLA